MYSKRKNIIYVLAFVFILSIILFCCVFNGNSTEISANGFQLEKDFDDEYAVNSEIEIPSATYTFEGKTYNAKSFCVYLPNGEKSKLNNFIADSVGKYTITYYFEINNELVEKSKEFYVNQNNFEVSSGTSTAEWGDLTLDDSKQGIKVSLSNGDSFTFNKPIDLTKVGDNIISFYSENCNNAKNRLKISSVDSMIITLTDCYNPKNYVDMEIVYSNSQGEKYPYYRASANGQDTAGFVETDVTAAISANRMDGFIDGKRYLVRFSTNGVQSTIPSGDNKTNIEYTLSYDTNKNIVYFKDIANHLVSQVDNEGVFPDGTFKGFTTGEVYVSIKGSGYLESYLNVEISSIGEYSGDELQQGTFRSVSEPTLNVNSEKDMYVVAKDQPVELFSSTAYDYYLSKKTDVKVYYNNGLGDSVPVRVVDNKFVPNKLGIYTAVYSVQNNYGEGTVSYINYKSTDVQSPISVKAEISGNIPAGQEFTLPKIEVSSLNGDVSYKVYSIFDNEKIEIDTASGKFIPTHVGKYEIRIECQDEISSLIRSYELVSTASDTVSYLDGVRFPKYLTKNASYSFDKVYAYTFKETNPKANLAELYVKKDDADFEKIDLDNYKVTASQKIVMKYSFKGTDFVSGEIPVIDVGFDGNLKLGEYFVGDFKKTNKADGVRFDAVTEGKTDRLDFINPISISSFDFKFVIPSDAAFFGSVKILLTDYVNPENTIYLVYTNKKVDKVNHTFPVTNFNGTKEVWKQDVKFTDTILGVSYNDTLNLFVDEFEKRYSYTNNFSSDKAYLSIIVEGISGKSAIEIRKVCNQPFSESSEDIIKPIVSFEKSGGVRVLNDVITIGAISSMDILSPILRADCKITMKLPSGKYAQSVDGTLLDGSNAIDRDYDVKLTVMGTYRVEYEIMDLFGNTYKSSFPVYVQDNCAPTITLDNQCENSVVKGAFGTKIKVSDYKVSDDITSQENLNVFVSIIAPSGKAVNCTDGYLYADEKGTFVVMYSCYDEVGNLTTVSYKMLIE